MMPGALKDRGEPQAFRRTSPVTEHHCRLAATGALLAKAGAIRAKTTRNPTSPIVGLRHQLKQSRRGSSEIIPVSSLAGKSVRDELDRESVSLRIDFRQNEPFESVIEKFSKILP